MISTKGNYYMNKAKADFSNSIVLKIKEQQLGIELDGSEASFMYEGGENEDKIMVNGETKLAGSFMTPASRVSYKGGKTLKLKPPSALKRKVTNMMGIQGVAKKRRTTIFQAHSGSKDGDSTPKLP
jgi:hypothetical protein